MEGGNADGSDGSDFLFNDAYLEAIKDHIVHCLYGARAELFVSMSENNPNRNFWRCSFRPSLYIYIKWHDEWKSERSLALLNEVRTMNLHLHRAMKDIEALRKQIGSLNEVVTEANQEAKCWLFSFKLFL
ncbi:conserved hypothetical protein [Ricinus communis]|uniref:Uncharacterized protein n=1 Tax=Ricinus communis TaxID=3988 RepID=B9RT87_RICCO|nr:conserved hypothetical protein [Ricinus communis]